MEERKYTYSRINNLVKRLNIGMLSLGVSFNKKNSNDLIKYLELIKQYQKKMNITAIRDVNDIIDKHFLDSLSAIQFIQKEVDKSGSNVQLIDIGSGAGLPGIPIKIFFPDTKMLLLEAKKNKKVFLDTVVSSLELKKTAVLQNRAEKLGKMAEHREKYHIVVSRAVAQLGVLSEYSLPFCKIGGVMIAFKGSSYLEELRESYKVIEKLGGALESINLIKIPSSEYIRTILIIRKTFPTPVSFPRRNGIPLKRPLCF